MMTFAIVMSLISYMRTGQWGAQTGQWGAQIGQWGERTWQWGAQTWQLGEWSGQWGDRLDSEEHKLNCEEKGLDNEENGFMSIKLTMYLSFLYGAGHSDLDSGKSISRAVEGVTRCHFRAPKSLDFQGPSLPTVLVMDLPESKSLRPAPYKQQPH